MFHLYLIAFILLLVFVLAGLFVFLRLHISPAMPIQYQNPDFRDRAGFRVTDLPADEIIMLKQSQLLSRDLAQLDFEIEPGHTAQLRIGRTGTSLQLEDFPGTYTERRFLYFDGIRTVFQASPGGPALITWSNDGFDYALYFPQTEITLAGGLADDFVTETKTENR